MRRRPTPPPPPPLARPSSAPCATAALPHPARTPQEPRRRRDRKSRGAPAPCATAASPHPALRSRPPVIPDRRHSGTPPAGPAALPTPPLPGTAASWCCLQLFPSQITLRFPCFVCPLLARLARSHFLDCTRKNLRYYNLDCDVRLRVLSSNNLRDGTVMGCALHDSCFPAFGVVISRCVARLCCCLQSSESARKAAVVCRLRGNLFVAFWFSSFQLRLARLNHQGNKFGTSGLISYQM